MESLNLKARGLKYWAWGVELSGHDNAAEPHAQTKNLGSMPPGNLPGNVHQEHHLSHFWASAGQIHMSDLIWLIRVQATRSENQDPHFENQAPDFQCWAQSSGITFTGFVWPGSAPLRPGSQGNRGQNSSSDLQPQRSEWKV